MTGDIQEGLCHIVCTYRLKLSTIDSGRAVIMIDPRFFMFLGGSCVIVCRDPKIA